MKCWILAISLAVMIAPVQAAVVSVHVFGGSGEEAARAVVVLPDGGLLLAGEALTGRHHRWMLLA